ncbi:hypothetical protein ACIQPT_16120 [Streptomyces sp. NPDC091289]|uniref:hypothetical protein n=1 Tax=Streptomyces sp. NPDC091289 TaxID=3365989 RepID=UPI00381BB74E
MKPSLSRRRIHTVLAGLTALVLATGVWRLVEGGDATSDCGSLARSPAMVSALGPGHSGDMTCPELGDAVKSATTGDSSGPRPEERANAMKKVFNAVSDSVEVGRGLPAEIRRPLAEALAGYTDDLQEVLDGTNSRYHDAGGPSGAVWKGTDGFHVSVYKTSLVPVLRALSESPEAYAVLRNAQTDWGARTLAAAPADSSDAALMTLVTVNAAALGTYDGIAADIVRAKKGTSGEEWADTVYGSLREPSRFLPRAVPSTAVSDEITRGWRETLSTVPDNERIDHLKKQGTHTCGAWSDAHEFTAEKRAACVSDCRGRAEGSYQDVVRSLS